MAHQNALVILGINKIIMHHNQSAVSNDIANHKTKKHGYIYIISYYLVDHLHPCRSRDGSKLPGSDTGNELSDSCCFSCQLH